MSSEYNHNDQVLIAEKLRYRNKRWESIIKQQFQLAYFGKIGFSESQELSVFEREFLFNLLIDQKNNEKKEVDRINNSKKNNKSSKKKPKHRH